MKDDCYVLSFVEALSRILANNDQVNWSDVTLFSWSIFGLLCLTSALSMCKKAPKKISSSIAQQSDNCERSRTKKATPFPQPPKALESIRPGDQAPGAGLSEGEKKDDNGDGKKPEDSTTSKKNEKEKKDGSKKDTSKKSKKGNTAETANSQEKKKEDVKGKDVFKKPENESAVAAKKDPNYQTLCGLNNDLFGPDKNPKKQFKAPTKVEKADVKDPQYETLVGLGDDLFKEEKKEEEGKKKEFKTPEKVQKADAKDPQYETLNEVDKGIFNNNDEKASEKKEGGEKKEGE